MRRWKAGRRGFFHSTLQSLRNHHPSVSITLRHRKERIASAKVGVVRDSLTSSSSPFRGPDDIDFREPVYGSPARSSHDAVIRVYDDAGNVIATQEQASEFKEW